MMRLVAVIVTSLALAVGAGTANASNFVVHVHGANHSPKAGKLWRLSVSARTRSGRGLRAAAYYQFLYGGQVVSTQYPNPHSHKRAPKSAYHFRGSFKDTLLFPKRAIGIPLTLRVVVRVGRTTKHADWKVKVHR